LSAPSVAGALAAYDAAWRDDDARPPRPWYWQGEQRVARPNNDDDDDLDLDGYESADVVLATDYRLLQVFTGK
jgi:hypothetical protein